MAHARPPPLHFSHAPAVSSRLAPPPSSSSPVGPTQHPSSDSQLPSSPTTSSFYRPTSTSRPPPGRAYKSTSSARRSLSNGGAHGPTSSPSGSGPSASLRAAQENARRARARPRALGAGEGAPDGPGGWGADGEWEEWDADELARLEAEMRKERRRWEWDMRQREERARDEGRIVDLDLEDPSAEDDEMRGEGASLCSLSLLPRRRSEPDALVHPQNRPTTSSSTTSLSPRPRCTRPSRAASPPSPPPPPRPPRPPPATSQIPTPTQTSPWTSAPPPRPTSPPSPPRSSPRPAPPVPPRPPRRRPLRRSPSTRRTAFVAARAGGPSRSGCSSRSRARSPLTGASLPALVGAVSPSGIRTDYEPCCATQIGRSRPRAPPELDALHGHAHLVRCARVRRAVCGVALLSLSRMRVRRSDR